MEPVTSKNSRPGAALLVVLFVVMAATLISLGFIAKSDVELTCGRNVSLRMQMDYLAQSGLVHAKALITNPQDADTESAGYWAGDNALQIEAGDDYYDLTVARNDSDPADRCTYDIQSLAYRQVEAQKTAQSYLNARLRLDPCIAYWAGADTTVSNTITVNGDVYCSGNLTNLGTINGDVFASGTITITGSGTVLGQKNESVSTAPIDPLNIQIDDFDPQYYFQHDVDSDYVAYTPKFPAPGDDIEIGTDPAGVIVYNGQLILNQDVSINGTLIVNGDLILNGNSLTITSVKNFPALVVNGDPNAANGRLTVTGLVQVDNMYVGAAAGDITITGALVAQGGMTVAPGYTANITITTAPMIASTKISPDGTTANAERWTPIGGAFFKSIKRK
jgi:cytoskeletal protein CcmA (bactofilin family)